MFRRRHTRLALLWLVLAVTPTAAQPIAERAEDWEALFLRTSGWTGADGIYSFALSGVDSPGAFEKSRTLFVFSDTFVGEVGPDGERAPGWTIVNNTLGLAPAGPPDAERIRFGWGRDGAGKAEAVWRPETPRSDPGEWYWLMDGVVLGSELRLFALRMRSEAGGLGFAVAGVAGIRMDLAGPDPVERSRQVDLPLFRPPAGAQGDVVYGQAVLANTVAAGASTPDGYLYVYGVRSDFLNKKLLVARVRPETVDDFGAWRFWDGGSWTPELEAAAPVTDRISQELSVTPLADGRVVAVFQLDALGRDVALRVGESPVGPFGPPVSVWRAPEPDLGPDVFVYNAKAHPHLSAPGELLVSYNVNSFRFADNLEHADLYRPRFVRVDLARLLSPPDDLPHPWLPGWLKPGLVR